MRWNKKAPVSRWGLWYEWFAWYPVNLTDEKCTVWLERVIRKDEIYYGGFGDSVVESEFRLKYPLSL